MHRRLRHRVTLRVLRSSQIRCHRGRVDERRGQFLELSALSHDTCVVETTGGFTSVGLELEAKALQLSSLTQAEAIEIGTIAQEVGLDRKLPIAVEVRMKDWIVFHASLPGSTPENDWWIGRKARVVNLTGRSTIHERVIAEEQGIDWHAEKGLEDELYAIHGGGLALNVVGLGLTGVLIVSGLPQVEDHLLGVEIITEYLARKGEQQ
jgi:uncharacterized protein (UPF0303 family)